jgi:hypothetical protein
MKRSSIIAHLTAAAMFASAAAWALQQQVGYMLAAFACHRGNVLIWGVSVVVLVIFTAGMLVSWRGLRQEGGASGTDSLEEGRPRGFLAFVSLMLGAIFLFAILLQAAAAVFLPACMA